MYKGQNKCTECQVNVQRAKYVYKGPNKCTKGQIGVEKAK